MRRSPHLTVSIKISLILSLLVFAPPATAQPQTLTGWFSFIVADYPTDTDLTSETTYILTEDSGERHELLIDVALMQPLGGPVALNRKRVTVEGEWEEVGPAATEKFRVYSIELAASPSTPLQWEPFAADSFPAQPAPLRPAPLPAAESESHVRGSQAWVTILCRFGDMRDVTPHPVSHYEKMTEASYPGLGHYWDEASYGNIPNLAGSIVVGWYNLSRPQSYYQGAEGYDVERILKDCTAAADADVFFPDFAGINLVFNRDFDSSTRLYNAGRGGSHFLTLDGRRRFWGVTWLPPWSHAKQDTWAHEMGHAFGLPHSSGPYGQDDPLSSPTTYDSEWDVMSGGQSLSPYPGYGYLGVHTIAYHKDFLGWIPLARKYVAPRNSTRTITLERLAQPGSAGYLMAQIPIGDSPTDFYTVETRLFAGYDDEIPGEAVVIHKVDTTRADRLAQVVDIDNNGDPNDEGAMWTVGEAFTDLASGLQVSVDAEHATGFQVTIAYTVCAEALSSTRQLLRGRAGNFSVEVEAPSGCRWATTSHSPWITVIAGSGSGNGRVSYAVVANPSLNARTGTLTIAGQILTVTQAGVNDNLFENDMENGTEGWWAGSCTLPERDDCALDPYPWALTTASSHSGTHAWTDSPNGNYQNNVTSYIFSPRIDLTEVSSATLVFWHRYAFARGDRGGVSVQVEDGEREQTTIRRVTGTNSTWQQVSLDLSPFVGQSIRIIFHLSSDATRTADGWYIDDVAVFSTDFDAALAPDPDYCQDFGPCSAGQGDCDPGQCADGLVCANDVGAQYGLPAHYDVCEAVGSQPNPDYCRDFGPCNAGEGDCDPGQCADGLVCANDVGAQYGLPAHYDVCEVVGNQPNPDYCQDFGPCSVGQGDCDPGQCADGLVCANDVGAQYDLPAHYDVCEAIQVKQILFEDDMESGTSGWVPTSCSLPERDDCSLNPYPWALTTASSRSGSYAWTDSPGGHYQNNVLAELYSPQIDLTEVESATLVFWHRYDFASGDQGIVRVHWGNGKWTDIRRVTGTNSTWQQVSLDLSPFVGQSIQFSFSMGSDATRTADGWYIDDVAVFSTDFEPPPNPDYCRDFGPCSAGRGDCDPGQCADGLVCVNDVGAQYGLPAHYDVCEVPSG